MTGYPKELSRNLRDAFPGLTVARLDKLWAWMVTMPRGQVMPAVIDTDLVSADELVVVLHLARELAHRHAADLCDVINEQSARRKRSLYPNSYEEER